MPGVVALPLDIGPFGPTSAQAMGVSGQLVVGSVETQPNNPDTVTSVGGQPSVGQAAGFWLQTTG